MVVGPGQVLMFASLLVLQEWHPQAHMDKKDLIFFFP